MDNLKGKLAIYARRYVSQIILVALVIVFTILRPDAFLKPNNLLSIVRQVSMSGIVALGVSFLMLTGNLDFSVGAIFAFSGVLCNLLYLQGVPILLCMLCSILCSCLLSMLTGFVSMKFSIPMLITSIAMQQGINGLNIVLTNGAALYGLPQGIKFLGQGYVLGIPFPVILFIAIALLVSFVLNKTYLGRYFFAVGGSNEVARLSGINVNKVKMIASAICGVLTGFAGLIMMSRSFSGNPNSGASLSTDVISAAVLGGVSIMGGTGKTSGVVTGILIIGILSSGLVMINVSTNFQNIIKGMVLLLAVIMDSTSKSFKQKKVAA